MRQRSRKTKYENRNCHRQQQRHYPTPGKGTGNLCAADAFYIDGQLYYEDITLSQEEFYHKLEHDAEISTSMPATGDVMDMWDKLLKDYDEVVHIPMSSGLSSSCAAATALAEEYGGRVHVVDNQRISVTLRQSAEEAKILADKGWDGKQIKDYLEKTKKDSSIYITLETLKYLKKGGRITPRRQPWERC